MVPGNLPSQLEILSTGQTYYETVRSCPYSPARHMSKVCAPDGFSVFECIYDLQGAVNIPQANVIMLQL